MTILSGDAYKGKKFRDGTNDQTADFALEMDALTSRLQRLQLAGTDEQELAPPILSLCHGIFID